MENRFGTVETIVRNVPPASWDGLSTHRGQLYLDSSTGQYYKSLSAGRNVEWVEFNGSSNGGAISIVPITQSDYDALSDPDPTTLYIIVETVPTTPVGDAPVITTLALNSMTVGIPFSQVIQYTGATVTETSVQAGSLPDGLDIGVNNGIITVFGTPETAVGFSVTLQAINEHGSGSKAYGGSVNSAPVTPQPSNGATLFGTNPPIGTVAAPYSDGPSNMRAGNRFYTTRNGGASIIGARLWNPVGSPDAFLNEPITAYAYVDTYNGQAIKGIVTFGHAPVRTKTGPTGKRVAGTWTEVLFDTPLQLPKIGAGVVDSLMTIAFNVGPYYVMSTTTLAEGDSVPGTSGDIHLAESNMIVRAVHSLSVNDGEVYPAGPIYGVDFIAASV